MGARWRCTSSWVNEQAFAENLELLLNPSVHLKHGTPPVAIGICFFFSPPFDFRRKKEVTPSLRDHYLWVELILLLVLYRYASLRQHMLCQLLGKVDFFSELSLMVALK